MLDRIEQYYDAVPRAAARVEDHGPLRLFISEGVPWPYYARPAGGDISADDVRAMRRRQWELGVPETFEWVAERAVADRPGGARRRPRRRGVPLMMLRAPLGAPPVAAKLRRLEPDDAALAASRAVADVAFGAAGTARGEGGRRARPAVGNFPARRLGSVRERMAGLTITVVAEGDDGSRPSAPTSRSAA